MSELVPQLVKDIIDIKRGFAFSSEDYQLEGLPILRVSNIKSNGCIDDDYIHLNRDLADFYEKYLVSVGDILLVMVGATTGKLGLVTKKNIPALLNQNLWNLKPRNIVDAKYLQYKAAQIIEGYLAVAQGSARDFLKQGDFEKYRVKIHSDINKQKKIAKILSTVDNVIEQTQALIDKYTAIKQGMMADLFTRGIDLSGTPETNPNHGQLRPSFEEAPELYKETELGWVPREWEVESLGEISEKITSGSRDWASYYSENGDLFVRISNLTREHINFRWNSIRYVDIGGGSEGERTRLIEGDILISITADLGIIGVIPNNFGRAFINQHTALVRIGCENDSRFIGNFLGSHGGQIQFDKYNDSGAKAGLNLPTIASLNCVLPKFDEQIAISNTIDAIDSKVAKQKTEKLKYEKIKKGLMQDLLTGKVRVNA